MSTDLSTLDEQRVEKFAGRLLGTYTEAMVALMIDLGARTGALDALASGGGTSTEIADRAGLEERYVREWLGSLVTAGIADHDPPTGRYALPAEHALCLTGGGSLDLSPLSRVATLLAGHVAGVARAFREGGGVPYEAFRPEFTDVMDGMSRGSFDSQLIDGILSRAGDTVERLSAGVRAADIGCGTGHAVNLMARAFPRSQFTGYDTAEDGIAQARAEAAQWGLTNATFEVLDVVDLPLDPPFALVFAFDAVHDQAHPARVLARIHDALAPDGAFVMVDVRAGSAVEDNVGNPFAPLLYGFSTLHCLTVSLAQGGTGLGAMWGEQLARQMLAEAGFVDVTVDAVPDDPLNALYVARRG
jgi:SAM-dependent methyltransferase